MVTTKEKIKVYFKYHFIRNIYLFFSKLLEVVLSSFAILLVLGLFGYSYTLRNFFSCMAVYFIYEELKPKFLQNHKRQQRIKNLRGVRK